MRDRAVARERRRSSLTGRRRRAQSRAGIALRGVGVGIGCVAALALGAAGGRPVAAESGVARGRVATSTGVGARPGPRSSRPRPGSWTTEGGSRLRWGDANSGLVLHPLHREWSSDSLDGSVYGEPLIDDGSVYVATESDTVYALSARTGAIRWHTQLGTPVPSSILPCGDIKPTVGVTSTMVLDPASHTLFASGEVFARGGVVHLLFGIDDGTGAIRFSRNLDVASSSPPAQLQRVALALNGSDVLVGFGGNAGDCGHYHGELVSVSVTGHYGLRRFEVRTAAQGAIWAPGGIALSSAGDIYLATGNGSPPTPYNGANSVIELAPSLRELQYFAPRSFAFDSEHDLDLGSTVPLLLRGGLVFQLGKAGVAYLLDAHHLGGIGGEIAKISSCAAWGGSAYSPPVLYLGCPDGIRQLTIKGHDHMVLGWSTAHGIEGPPTLAGGLLWTIDRENGTLLGLSPRTGRVVITSSVGPVEHFATPSAGEGLLLVPTASGVVAFAGPRGFVR